MNFTRSRIGLFGLLAATFMLAGADDRTFYVERPVPRKPKQKPQSKSQPIPVRCPATAAIRYNSYPERSIEDVAERQDKQAAKLARRAARFAKERQP